MKSLLFLLFYFPCSYNYLIFKTTRIAVHTTIHKVAVEVKPMKVVKSSTMKFPRKKGSKICDGEFANEERINFCKEKRPAKEMKKQKSIKSRVKKVTVKKANEWGSRVSIEVLKLF